MPNDLTVSGNLAADPELRYTPNGKAVVKFSIGDTPRRLNPSTNQWEPGTTLWVNVEAWDGLAENSAASLKKGTSVIVTGTLTQENYETKEGKKANSIKLRANDIGPSLKYATAQVERKNSANTASGSGAQAAPRPAAADEETPF
jgi:single-strand DNA-binding protein